MGASGSPRRGWPGTASPASGTASLLARHAAADRRLAGRRPRGRALGRRVVGGHAAAARARRLRRRHAQQRRGPPARADGSAPRRRRRHPHVRRGQPPARSPAGGGGVRAPGAHQRAEPSGAGGGCHVCRPAAPPAVSEALCGRLLIRLVLPRGPHAAQAPRHGGHAARRAGVRAVTGGLAPPRGGSRRGPGRARSCRHSHRPGGSAASGGQARRGAGGPRQHVLGATAG
mmetsp:Transcript_37335/g.95434  ORF Transcript_37335/g.95434 Transcript_37335/m.95434 type:complete len:230 (-) Transcript_37335:260-949(-)